MDRLHRIALAFVDQFDLDLKPRLFGTWPGPLTELLSPVPVGEPCFICRVGIADGDSGEFLPSRAGLQVPFHVECLVLLFYGHQLEVCECYGYAGCVNADGSPRVRDAALLAGPRLKARPDLLYPGAGHRAPRGEPS